MYNIDSRILAGLLFIGIILFYNIGFRLWLYKKKRNPVHDAAGLGPFEGAMLGLLSLLLAFTFNKSASNYDTRRSMLINETNAIGTALLRTDLYPDSVRLLLRNDLKEYVTERIQYYKAGEHEKEIQNSLQKAQVISEKIWQRVVSLSDLPGSNNKSMQMLPAVTTMSDAVNLREEARNAHVPNSILWLLFILCAAGSFIVGYASKPKKADWIVLLSYSLMTVLTVYVILDLDQPTHGIITTSSTHKNMYNLLNSIQENSIKK